MESHNLQSYWEKALPLMERAFTTVVYETWIKPLTPLYIEDDHVFVIKTNVDFFKSTIEHRYLYEIINSLRAVTQENELTVRIVSPQDLEYKNNGFPQTNEFIARSRLKSKYIFETFVRGKSNELACAAAMAVAEEPGMTTYNPLF